ncbi:MAG: outer membrane beta-barrel protein [Dyadobacter fermentans]
MRFTITSLILFTLSFHCSKAQKSFEPGYLLTSPGDTVKGYIDYKSWPRNPETINFRTAPDQKTETYGLSDIEGFGVHGENYVKADVEINISPTEIDKLSTSPTPQIVKTVAFLMVVRRGPKSLFYLKDRDGKVQFYVSNKAERQQLLLNHRYLGGPGNVVNVSHYREQLKTFFSDCPGLVSDQRLLPYTQSSLSKVFDRYYEKCSVQPAAAVQSKRGSSAVQVGLVAGASGAQLSFEGPYDSEIVDSKFPVSYRPTGGVFLNLLFPRLKQRFSLYNELAFTSFKSSVVKQTTYSDNSYVKVTNTLGFGYIKLTNMIRYQFPVGNVNLFLNAGVTNGRALSIVNERKAEDRFQTSEPVVSKRSVIAGARKYEFGLIFGIGVNYKQFGLELRHESSDGMSVYSTLKSDVKRNYLLLSYRFARK